jgi:hypothetical protein
MGTRASALGSFLPGVAVVTDAGLNRLSYLATALILLKNLRFDL